MNLTPGEQNALSEIQRSLGNIEGTLKSELPNIKVSIERAADDRKAMWEHINRNTKGRHIITGAVAIIGTGLAALVAWVKG